MTRWHDRLSRSSVPKPDDDADYQLALKLSAEWNGEQPAPPAHQPGYDEDADFALAMQLQYENEETHRPPTPAQGSIGGPSATRFSEQSAWGLDGKDDIRIAEYHSDTPSGKMTLQTFTDFTAYIKSCQCSVCTERRFQSELDVINMFQDWVDGKAALAPWFKCKVCTHSTCVACIPEPFAKQSSLTFQDKRVSWCCADGRLFVIWVLLCGFDQHFCATRSKGTVAAKPIEEIQAKSKPKTKKQARGGGVGFGGAHRPQVSYMPGGMGYGSDMAYLDTIEAYFDNPNPSFKGKGHTLNPPGTQPSAKVDGKSKALSAQQAEDNFSRLILELLKDLLPSFERDASFDVEPPEAVTDMLVHSKILNYCTELLRNDSLADATKRKDLYSTMLSFLQTVGMHHMANRALFSERPIQPDTVNLLTLTFGGVPGSSMEMASSIARNLRNLNTQSVLVLQSAKSNEQDFRTEDGQNMLLLCRQISELSQYLSAYTNGGSSGNSNPPTEDLSIIDVTDDEVLATHTFAPKAKALNFSPPGRFKRLITEITTLKTGLPPGIFVRYGENRPDVLKCVIVGPIGTPYENGLYEFDFFCDTNFPNVPPVVTFKGTGGGRVSINPNLYADGKVCLSLLGTWSGEPWVPGESTLLQILISLQAMIFCEEPWYNEPGREAAYHRGSGYDPAAAYNQKIREHTVRHAVLTWLDHTPPLWKAVVDQHFKQNANKILQTASEWTKTKIPVQRGRRGIVELEDIETYDPPPMMGGGRWPVDQGDLASMLPRLQTALQKCGATFVIQDLPQPAVQQPAVPPPQPTGSYPMPLQPMMPQGLAPPSPYSHTQPTIPTMQPPHGGSWGSGHVLGSSRGRGNATLSTRGRSFLGAILDGTRRYETRSASRGRGGSEPSGGAGSSASNAPSSLFGGDATRGRGAPAPRRGGGGRTGHGRGGRGDGP